MRFRHLDVVTEGYAFAHSSGFPYDVPVSAFHVKVITPYTVTAGSKNHPALFLAVSAKNAYTWTAGTKYGTKSPYTLFVAIWFRQADSWRKLRARETLNVSGLKSY